MKILLANDDGYMADGLNYVKKYMIENGYDFKISAPQKEMSAMSSSLTLYDYVNVKKIEHGIAINGTPADCVIIGGKILYENRKPDLLISGINMGPNLGTDIIYSGTVAAAISASLSGVKSAAISTSLGFDIENVSNDFKKHFDKVIKLVLETSYSSKTILNINIPKDHIKGIKVTPLAMFSYNTILVQHEEKSNHYRVTGSNNYVSNIKHDNDKEHFDNGYMTITPIQYDLTNHSFIDEFKVQLDKFTQKNE